LCQIVNQPTYDVKMVDKKGSVKPPRIGESGYVLPDRLPCGEVMKGLEHDVDGAKKGSWKIGKPLGCGGFGEIYLCEKNVVRKVDERNASLAMKIEPHENGPLFIERNFYIRAVLPKTVEEYRKHKKIQTLGIPSYKGSGSHTYNGDKFRFLVMDRLGKDLEKTFLSGKRIFPPSLSYDIALKVLETLEYIHDQGYAHNDIKAQNLLLGPGGNNNKKESHLYLVDFGLVSRYHRKGVHLQYEPDDRKAHDGTIAYTSRDAHIGAHSRRSDLEMLGYNLVHWMSGKLPWMDSLSNYEFVHMQKNGFMEDIKYFLNFCFGEKVYPDVLHDYLSYVVSLEFDTEPDYKKCRDMFEKALNKELFPKKSKPSLLKAIEKLNEMDYIKESSEPLPSITHDITPAKGRKRRHSEPERPKFKFEVDENPRQSPRIKRRKDDKDSQNNNEDNDTLAPPSDSLMSRMDSIIDNWSWERVIGSGNCELSELLLDHDSIASSGILTTDSLADEHRELAEKEQKESLANPTPAMKTILKRIKEKEKKKDKSIWQHQLKHTLGKTRMMKSPATKGIGRSGARSPTWDLTPNELTPAMEIVMRKKSKSTFRRRFR